MISHCDLCREPMLERVYQPEGGGRGLSVHLCAYCGLVQSLPRIDRAPRRSMAVSGEADWGNVRYGKGFRTEACLAMVKRHAALGSGLTALDVGSNRGSFARAFLVAAPRARLVAVEPDERVVRACADLPRTELVQARIEDAGFPDNRFDIIHSCHTIEHLASPGATLAAHWRALKPGGLLVIDAPNIDLIGGDDILEEWFIDKHLYHFSTATLGALIETAGFEIVEGPEPSDRENLLFAARKKIGGKPMPRANDSEVDRARGLIAQYVTTRARNLAVMTHVAAELNRLAPKRVALWGAGRLFDALVRHGKFDPSALTLLIDKHLKGHVGERHGVTLATPDDLSGADVGVIVAMTRAFAGEMASEARRLAPTAEFLTYSDLLARARKRDAA